MMPLPHNDSVFSSPLNLLQLLSHFSAVLLARYLGRVCIAAVSTSPLIHHLTLDQLPSQDPTQSGLVNISSDLWVAEFNGSIFVSFSAGFNSIQFTTFLLLETISFHSS